MKNKSRLLTYIIINILISAATTMTVIWLWERAHPRPETNTPLSAPMSENTTDIDVDSVDPPASDIEQISEPTMTFVNEDIEVSIRTVVGAGNLDVEYVEIINQSDGPIDLTNWELRNEDDQHFTFPAMILNNGGAIKIFSKKGVNSVIELYWQADAPIWRSGGTVRLMNANGNTITTYSIP